MIRKSSFNINFSTQSKKDKLDHIILEFKRCVNFFIDKFWQDKFVSSIKTGLDFVPDSWLSKRLTQQAYKTAIETIKSVRKRDKNKRFNKYKRLYAIFKKKDLHKSFTDKKFSELNLNFKIKPEYKADVVPLNERFLQVLFDKNSFDAWFKLSSIGDKVIIKLPSKKHKHFNNLIKKGFNYKQSGCLRKVNGLYILDLFLEKDTPEIKEEGKKLGIDLGINKLISTSNGDKIGLEIKSKLNKLDRKKYSSKSYLRTVIELKQYIDLAVKSIPVEELNLVVLEDLKGIANNTRGKMNKKMRKYLSRWNRFYFQNRLQQKCEENGVYLAFVDPAYTSQTCYSCGNVDKLNRQGECFCCKSCGHQDDADINGAKNILRRFVGKLSLPIDKNQVVL